MVELSTVAETEAIAAIEPTSEVRDGFRLDVGQSVQSASKAWYRNIQFLGRGGSAVTFLVVSTGGPFRGNPFALKIFQRRTKPERREALIREAQFLRGCNHPAIMRIYDEGVFSDEHPFFVAEYLPQTLRMTINSRSLSLVEKLLVAVELVSGLAYLAGLSEPVIHRDLKPENIFLKGRSAVLGDFGLLKKTGEQSGDDVEFVKESIGIGMARHYRTPDLVKYLTHGVPPSPVSDVFQLGLVLAELFTGWNPLLPSASAADPCALSDIRVDGKYRDRIRSALEGMLTLDSDLRPEAEKVLGWWEQILRDAALDQHELSGRSLTG